MKSSAIVTALSFLAATALGAALIAGCELSSSTVDDTDGGDPPSNDSGAKDSGTDSNTDAGDSGSTCNNPKQKEAFSPAQCQSCLDNSCCTALQTCFNIPGDEGAGKTDCNAYSDCINDCNADPANDTDEKKLQCYEDLCDSTAADGVKAAYEALLTCADTSCATPCSQ